MTKYEYIIGIFIVVFTLNPQYSTAEDITNVNAKAMAFQLYLSSGHPSPANLSGGTSVESVIYHIDPPNGYVLCGITLSEPTINRKGHVSTLSSTKSGAYYEIRLSAESGPAYDPYGSSAGITFRVFSVPEMYADFGHYNYTDYMPHVSLDGPKIECPTSIPVLTGGFNGLGKYTFHDDDWKDFPIVVYSSELLASGPNAVECLGLANRYKQVLGMPCPSTKPWGQPGDKTVDAQQSTSKSDSAVCGPTKPILDGTHAEAKGLNCPWAR